MSDRYLKCGQSTLGKKIYRLVGLPIPAPLKRAGAVPETLVDNILVGSTESTSLHEQITLALKDENITQLASANQSHEGYNSFGGLCFDATSINNVEDTAELYQFFHNHLKKIKTSGKIVIVGINPKQCLTSGQASVQRGLVGFIKSLAKEAGRKGITANLIYADESQHSNIASALRFFLSHRSAFVNGQVITVNNKAELSSPSISVPAALSTKAPVNWHKPLCGKVVLVTGASRGIGASIAQLLARDGAKVIGLDIPQAEAELKAAMSAIGGHAIAVNITDKDAEQLIDKQIVKLAGSVDVIVHNAGITRDKMLVNMPKESWQQVMDVNLASVERINAQLLDNKRINSGGRILCVSSISGIAGNTGQSNYAMSKASVIGMIESMSDELAKQNITINAVAPGFIETKMTAAIPASTRFFARRMCALSQGGLPEDVAETIAFLSSPQSQGITANLVRVCGLNIMGA